jgi:hypothetical protein
MKRKTLGAWALALAVALGVCIAPLNIHMANMTYSPIQTTQFAVQENCHGTPCYVTSMDDRLDRINAVATPVTLVLGCIGYFLLGWFEKER